MRSRPSNDVCWLTIAEIAELLRNRKISPVELTQVSLERIERLNPTLNAFISVSAESALAEARQAEDEIQKGRWRGPLHGVPMGLKDLFDTAGVRTTAASALLQHRVPTIDSEVVRRLKHAGAVFLGKLNMHEFAYGGSGIISFFGPVRNPWSYEHIAGGSSSGSAAAVAAGMCYGALGSDTGGSIRLPAAYCGIVGFKPSYGRVSARGVIPLSWSCDHVGPMTRSVADAALVLQAIAAYDSEDPTSVDLPVTDYRSALDQPKPPRIGIPRTHFYEKLDSEIEIATTLAISVIGKLASRVHEVVIPVTNETMILRAEAYACHSDTIQKTPDLYQPETLRRIRSGADISAADYIHARREMERVRHDIGKLFESVDLLITPTTSLLQPRVAELLANLDDLRSKEILMLRNTRPFNALGLPTVSVPCGLTRTGLPIGIQITGARGAEGDVLQLAHMYEQHTNWHALHPNPQA